MTNEITFICRIETGTADHNIFHAKLYELAKDDTCINIVKSQDGDFSKFTITGLSEQILQEYYDKLFIKFIRNKHMLKYEILNFPLLNSTYEKDYDIMQSNKFIPKPQEPRYLTVSYGKTPEATVSGNHIDPYRKIPNHPRSDRSS